MTAIIETDKLTKTYGEHRGIVDVDLRVDQGEVFGFLGPNGAGKTTTIRTVLDLIRPTSGTARVFGIESSVDPVAIHRRVGYIPGEFALYDRLTGGQTLRYFASLRGGVDPVYQASLIERFDIDPSRKFKEYSKGNKQKIGLVIALQHRPELLILDEPTSGLDPLVQQSFYALVRESKDEGRTVFLSSHILSEVERTCDRVAIIRDGRLVKVDSVEGLRDLAHHQVELRFAGPVPRAEFEGLPGASEVVVEDHVLRLRFAGAITPLVQAAARHELLDFVSREPSLEETFLAQYGHETAAAEVAAEARGMTAVTLSANSAWSRIYGFGSVYAKTIRDSRLSFIIVAGLVGSLLLSSGVAFGEAYATPESRAALADLVASLPPALAGIYGNPFPINVATLGGSIAWKTGASLGLLVSLWSVLALSGTLASEARRGSLELVAVTPLGMRRIALEKLAAHITVLGLVVIVTAVCTWIAGTAFATLPGDEIPWSAAIGYAAWVGLVALASGSVAFALAPLVGRGAAAGIAGAVLLGGYLINGYQAAVPAFASVANLTWFGWTVHHQPLGGSPDPASLIPVALVAIVLLAIGVEVFARRDLGSTTRIPWPSFPESLLGLGGPTGRSFGERLPVGLAWGIGMGLYAFVIGAAAKALGDSVNDLSPDTLAIVQSLFPDIKLDSAGGFLQLAFVFFGFILAGFAAATLVAGWASDEGSGRLDSLLTTPLARGRWSVAGGLGVYGVLVVLTAILAIGIGLGAAIGGGDIVTPVAGTVVLGLYAIGLAGIGLAVGGVLRTSFAGEVVAALVILTFLIDLVAPALKLPEWVHQLALTSHMGQPMVGIWDPVGIGICATLALGGLALSGWGIRRRDIAH